MIVFRNKAILISFVCVYDRIAEAQFIGSLLLG